MRVVALSGVPGTGKTTLADALASQGVAVVHLHDLAASRGLLGEEDPARPGTRLVDLDALADALHATLAARHEPVALVEGHFAHEMDCDLVVLLRCDPLVLVRRLRARGWSEEKVRENVEAEALDVLAAEVLDGGVPARELDVTRLGVEEAARALWDIVEAPSDGLKGAVVGTAAWSLEALPWS